MNGTNNEPNVIATQRSVFKRVFKVVFMLFCLSILVYGLMSFFSKSRFVSKESNPIPIKQNGGSTNSPAPVINVVPSSSGGLPATIEPKSLQ